MDEIAIRRWKQNNSRNMVVDSNGHYVAFQDHSLAVRAHAARIAALEAERDAAIEQAGRATRDYLDRCQAVERLTAERDRLQSEQDQLLSDSAIRSEQREKYEKLCGRLSVGKASQQEAIDAINALCRDNERLALLRGKSREKLRAALQAHHEWHLAQDRDGGAWGIDPVDAYSESGLCEQTIAALGLGDGQ